MSNTKKADILAGEGPGEDGASSPEEDTYIATVNDEGQYAIWQANLALPAGWRRQSAAMPRQACLAAITAVWHDIAPAGVRGAKRGTEGRDTAAAYAIPHRHHAPDLPHLLHEQASVRPPSAAVAP